MHTHRRSSARGYDREAPRATQPPLHMPFFLSTVLCPPSAPPSRAPYCHGLPAAGDPATWSVWGDDADTGIGAPPLHATWFAPAVPDFVPFGSTTDAWRPYGPAHMVYAAPDGAAAFGSPAGHRPWAQRIIAEEDFDDAVAAPPPVGDLLSWDAPERGGTVRECLVDGGVAPPPDLPPPLEPAKAPARDPQPHPRQQQQKQRRARPTPSRARRNSAQ